MDYNKIDPALLNGESNSLLIDNYAVLNGGQTVHIHLTCRFLFNPHLALESKAKIVLDKDSAPAVIDFKGEKSLASNWVLSDSVLCSIELSEKDTTILIDAWNESNPKWKIRRYNFTEKMTVSKYINMIQNILAYPNLSLFPSELGWINPLSVKFENNHFPNSKTELKVTKTNLIDILNWPSGFIKMIKDSNFCLENSEDSYRLFLAGFDLEFISQFVKNLAKISNPRKTIELSIECLELYGDKKIVQNRLLSAYKDSNFYDYLTMFKDYLKMSEDLQIKIKSKEIARGGESIIENGVKSSKMKMYHDNMAREFRLSKDAVLTKKFIAVNNAYEPHVVMPEKHYTEEVDNVDDLAFEKPKKLKYRFNLPKSPFDLEEEGRILGHCVGSYSARVSEDDCLIVLMRDTKSPSEPLLTIELYNTSSGIKIQQVQGKSRRQPNQAEQKEIDIWLNYLRSNDFKIKNSSYYKKLNIEIAERKKLEQNETHPN